MKRELISIVTFVLLCNSLIGQVALTKRVKTQLYDKGYDIVPVYKCTGNSLEYYSDAYAGETLEKFNVKMPELYGCTDTGYAFVYFSGFERSACKNYSVVIIGNAQSMYIPKIYIDRNHNLDFTDDGPSIEFAYNAESISFDLCNSKETTGCLHYRLSRYRLDNLYALQKNLDDFFTANAGTKKYLGMHNSFRIQCENQWGVDVKMDNDSFRIAVEDHNINGLYNEPGIDHLQLVPYGQEPVSNNANEGSIVLPKEVNFNDSMSILLQHLNVSYRVTAIAGNGQTITIRSNGRHKREAENLIGKKAPRFNYELLAFRKYNKIRKHKGTPVYLFFYNFKNADTTIFEQLTQLYNENKGTLTLIVLNYGNSPTLVKEFVKENYYMWNNGLATRKIYERYKVDQLPMGFYLDKKLRIQNVGVTPEEMRRRVH